MADAVTDSNFSDNVLNAGKPVLVDFWAEWCGPCKQLAPILDQVAEEIGDKVDVVKINIDENPETPTRYNVRGIPTLILFKDGQAKATKVGSLPKGALIDWLESEIA